MSSLWTLFKAVLYLCGSIVVVQMGCHEMHIADTNHHPLTCTCDQFLNASPTPGWYHITGCHLDTDERIEQVSTKYHDKDTGQPIVEMVYYIAHGSDAIKRSFLVVAVHPDDFKPDLDLSGMVVKDDGADHSGGLLDSEKEAIGKFGDRVATPWLLLKQGEQPSSGFGIALVIVGVLVSIPCGLYVIATLLTFIQKMREPT